MALVRLQDRSGASLSSFRNHGLNLAGGLVALGNLRALVFAVAHEVSGKGRCALAGSMLRILVAHHHERTLWHVFGLFRSPTARAVSCHNMLLAAVHCVTAFVTCRRHLAFCI